MPKTFDIIIPAYNEEEIIEQTLRSVYSYLAENYPLHNWWLTLANNASTDRTGEIGRQLISEMPRIIVRDVRIKGKGQAVYESWKVSKADILVFLDADLSVPATEIKKLIAPIQDGFKMAVGSRYLPGANVDRQLIRRLISVGYNQIVRLVLKTPFLDHQCGFKSIDRELFISIEPYLEERGWFFDTELLYFLDRKNIQVIEVPVRWQDTSERKSKVTSLNYNIRQGLDLVRRLRRRKIEF